MAELPKYTTRKRELKARLKEIKAAKEKLEAGLESLERLEIGQLAKARDDYFSQTYPKLMQEHGVTFSDTPGKPQGSGGGD